MMICRAIQQVIVSLLKNFLKTDGFNYDSTSGSGGNGLVNPSIENKCARSNETK